MGKLALVIAPTSQEAEAIIATLAGSGIGAHVGDVPDLISAISGDDYGVAILAHEALPIPMIEELGRTLAAQPPWADFPILLLAHRHAMTPDFITMRAQLGNVTLLECPLDPEFLTSGVRTALRARVRQRAAATYLREREIAEDNVRTLAATLETRVNQRTAELNRLFIEREAALQRMRESEELYRYTVELNVLMPWTADPLGRVQTASPRWLSIVGLTLAETQGDGWSRRLHSEDRERVLAAWHRTAADGEDFDLEFRVHSSDGAYRWYRSRAAPLRDSHGRVLRYYGTIVDVDEQRQALDRLQQVQAELIHVSRLSAMGAMASTLAHELNQPLTAIANYMRGCTRLMAGVTGDSVPLIMEALVEADQSAVRAGEIIRRLREMVTPGNLERSQEDLPLLIRQACKIALIDSHLHGIEYRLDLLPDARTVAVDRVQIQQVLINLLRNAVDALQQVSDRQIVISTERTSDNLCEVIVRDSGPGLSGEVKEKLFSTFNSTKEDGMGLGLSICRTIVETHGGEIWAENMAEGGTAFHFTLPCGGE